MAKIMVTGGSGFMGAYLVGMLAMRGDEPLIFDIVPPTGVQKALLDPVKDKIKIVRGNMLDLPTILNTIKTNEIDKVVHLARCGPAKLDIEGTLNMLEAVRLMELRRIVHMSTQNVYGLSKQYSPIDEDHPKFPSTGDSYFKRVYGAWKLACEHFGLDYFELYGVDFIATRPSTPYGLGMRPNRPILRPIEYIVQNAVKGVPVQLPTGGSFFQDVVYVKDLMNGVLLALDVEDSKLQHRIFNIATGEVTRISDVVEVVKELLPGAAIDVGDGMSEEQAKLSSSRGAYSIERARKELGYTPKFNLRKGVTDYVECGKKYL